MSDMATLRGWIERYPALGRLGPRRRHRIPVVHQMTVADCGAACLAMTLAYHGREVSLDQLRASIGVGRDGATASALLETARAQGLRGRAVTIEIEGLPFLTPAAILFWEFRHFVVFESWDAQSVRVVDPAGGRRIVPMDQFRRSFTGVALLFEPASGFEPVKAGERMSWRAWRGWHDILRHREALVRICATSLWMQIFGLGLPLLTGMIVDRIIPRRDYSLLLIVAAGMVLVNGFQIASTLVRSHLLLNLRTHLDARLTLDFLEHLVSLPYSFFQQRTAGDLMMRLSSNAALREIATSGMISGALDGVMVCLYLVLLFAARPTLGFLAVGLGVVRVVLLLTVAGRQRQLMSQSLEAQAKARSYEVEMLTGIETLKSMGVEHRAVQRWSNLFVDTLNVSLASGRLNIAFEAVMGGVGMASPLILLLVGSVWVLNGSITLGTMLALNALAMGFIGPFSSLAGSAMQFQIMRSYLDRIKDVLEASPEQHGEAAGRANALAGRIAFEDVSFKYGPEAPLVVRNITAEIQPRQHVALVGRSGSGKSTVAKLLVGLYPPTDGRILIDGVDLRRLECRSVRGQVGIVTQVTHLFAGSIRSNIALTDPDLPLDRVIEAARVAQIHDDIMAMPMGYETLLAEDGGSLSGGQRQRVALARALVRRPSIIVLDEATSQLDALTELRIMESLRRMQATMIISAHRLSTIMHADLILVLDGGSVVERGNHETLLARGGRYAELVDAQLAMTSAVAPASTEPSTSALRS
jgi:ATP-binding cassette, subfamily B, bacterial